LDGGSVDFERGKEELQASFSFPDMQDHKDIKYHAIIVIKRNWPGTIPNELTKEVHNFNFDRVCIFFAFLESHELTILTLCYKVQSAVKSIRGRAFGSKIIV